MLFIFNLKHSESDCRSVRRVVSGDPRAERFCCGGNSGGRSTPSAHPERRSRGNGWSSEENLRGVTDGAVTSASSDADIVVLVSQVDNCPSMRDKQKKKEKNRLEIASLREANITLGLGRFQTFQTFKLFDLSVSILSPPIALCLNLMLSLYPS